MAVVHAWPETKPTHGEPSPPEKDPQELKTFTASNLVSDLFALILARLVVMELCPPRLEEHFGFLKEN